MTAALFAGAALADGLTMLLLPPGGELNPIVAQQPLLTLGLKSALALVLLAMAARKWPYFSAVIRIGAATWTFGALMNALTVILW